jgi:DNA polymerase-3 subunit delta'
VATWDFPEQPEAKRLLTAALDEGPAHAYLFHGPRGVGKREAARQFASELLGGDPRVRRGAHPDLYVLEALGEMIRIDAIRELRRDLHMRPFEAARRVYLIFDADLLGQEAADALLKDLEEPPPYAVIVLVADDLGPLPETIRSRCQHVPFRRLSEKAIRAQLPDGLDPERATAIARVAAGRLDRIARLLDPQEAERRSALLAVARSVYAAESFEPAEAAERLLESVRARGQEAKELAEAAVEPLGLPTREAEQRVRRAQRGAEREELLDTLEELAAWYRDLVIAAVGAEAAVVHYDRLDVLREDASVERGPWPPRRSSGRPGGSSRSSTWRRSSRSRRSSCGCGGSSVPMVLLTRRKGVLPICRLQQRLCCTGPWADGAAEPMETPWQLFRR